MNIAAEEEEEEEEEEVAGVNVNETGGVVVWGWVQPSYPLLSV